MARTTSAWADLDEDEFAGMNKDLREAGYYLSWLQVYGTEENPLFLGLWLPNTKALEWTYSRLRDVDGFHELFDACAAWRVRPRMIPVSVGSKRYGGLWHDDSLGLSHVRHDLTSDEYQKETEELWEDGFYPVSVQAGGSGDDVRFSAVYAKRHRPIERQWAAVGADPSISAGMEAMVETFMKEQGIRAGQLAVARTETGISMALFFNKNAPADGLKFDILRFLIRLRSWPVDDLFPSVGIPPFDTGSAARASTIPADGSLPLDPVEGRAVGTLDGSASRGSSSVSRLSYLWEHLPGPFGEPEILSPRAPITRVVFREPGLYSFRLR